MSKKIHVRPGKGQSKAGFGVGIIFCLLGVFVVIPTFGLFGIFWTAIAGWITFVNYRNGFTDKQIDSQIIEIDDDGHDVTITSHKGFNAYTYQADSNTYVKADDKAADKEDVEERMKKLQSLYDQSLVTREEYEQKRKEILEDL